MGTEVMGIRGPLLCVALLVSGVSSASATMRIAEDRGGQIGQYIQNFGAMRESGERVVIDGNCLSACTMVLGLVPRDRICATSRARFGFHAAWMPDENGRPVTSPMGTQALWNIYPMPVRHWISRHGGLSRKMIYMEGHALHGIVASCDRPIERARLRSERHFTARPLRDLPASAASDRR
jgi:hypothetical protein